MELMKVEAIIEEEKPKVEMMEKAEENQRKQKVKAKCKAEEEMGSAQ